MGFIIKEFFDFEGIGGDYARLCSCVKENKKVSACGMGANEKIAVCSQFERPILYIVSDYILATKVFSQFSSIFGNGVALMPVFIDNLFYRRAQTVTPYSQRLEVLSGLSQGKTKIVVASADSLTAFLPNAQRFKNAIIRLEKGQIVDLDLLTKRLVDLGYKKEELVSEAGQFARRGDIFDVFPAGAVSAVRIEFWGDEIESVSNLDTQTQSTLNKIDRITISPNKDLFFDESETEKLISSLNQTKMRAQSEVSDGSAFLSNLDEIIDRLSRRDKSFSLDCVLGLLPDLASSIFDYLPQQTCVIVDEGKMVYDALINSSSEVEMRHKTMVKSGEAISDKCSGYFSADYILNQINRLGGVVHQKITNTNRFFAPEEVLNFKSLPISRYYHNFVELVTDIKNWQFNKFDVFLLAESPQKAQSLQARLEENDVFLALNKSIKISGSGQYIVPASFSGGFIMPNEKKVVISTTDLFAPKKVSSSVTANRKDVFSVPKVGDYVVHSFHGIGVCEGVTNLSSNFGSKDYVVVRYRDDDRLYVPIDSLNMLERFSGAETPKKLSKIGGVEFGKVKEKVKASVKKLAFDLTELYAMRESKRGYAFSPDNSLQLEFENSFAHIETEDQLKSIAEIKKDMESPKVMDRLLCGDVGFGKTEVAMRAIFKAVLDGKQVAFLAPTTILSEQHYNTCRARFEQFGVKVGVLNRFKTPAQSAKVLNDIAHGRADVVCGTHRLLSADVNFLDLGLVVLDEEQKFGVEDKEKLKNKYPCVDFLTLSATPIPRTLHMSLSGIRDVSIINTPPSERLPVQTFVCEYSEGLVRDAIMREIARGGQVFILFNQVDKIYAFADSIKKIVPEASVLVGHGQLTAKELEDTVYRFYKKEADVLICTTIIENGVDIENANTLIVCDSDKFGLSQLYQIRGRVGRGNRTAFAYFTYKIDKILSEEAYKRLDAISEFTEFGSGFKIAMRDLEIRGGGNIFGAEQHGFMQKVGYDLYSKMLGDAVAELKGQKVEEEVDVLMRISIDAYIPENFIENSSNRMTMYKNISAISSIDDKISLVNDLTDTFGKLPSPVSNLIDIAYAKSLAKKLKIIEVVSTQSGIKLIFEKPEQITKNEKIGNALFALRDKCALELGTTPMIKIAAGIDNSESLKRVIEFLTAANK